MIELGNARASKVCRLGHVSIDLGLGECAAEYPSAWQEDHLQTLSTLRCSHDDGRRRFAVYVVSHDLLFANMWSVFSVCRPEAFRHLGPSSWHRGCGLIGQKACLLPSSLNASRIRKTGVLLPALGRSGVCVPFNTSVSSVRLCCDHTCIRCAWCVPLHAWGRSLLITPGCGIGCCRYV